MKKYILLLMLIVIFSTFFSYSNEEMPELITARGKVLNVVELSQEDDIFIQRSLVTVRILNGEFRGDEIVVQHNLSGSIIHDLPVKEGDKVILEIDKFHDGFEAAIIDYARDIYIFYVLGIFIALILLIGRKTGIKTLITLTLTIFFVVRLLLPGMLRGYNPIILTIITSILITLVTIFIIAGINIKSISAIIGVMGGVIAAGLITLYVGSQVRLTGLSNDGVSMLMFIPQNISFDFRGLLFSGIILGALGAVMDVGISIASAMEEIKKANPLVKTRDLIMSGMNVGKDIMGTMTNTLILAYTGSTIPLLLLFMAYEISLIEIINLDIIATEIIRALSGTIGLVLTIPITAFTGGLLYEKSKKKVEAKE